MILASQQQTVGSGYGYGDGIVASNDAQGQAAAEASAASPYGPFIGSPVYGASPLSAVDGMLHHSRRSPESFRSVGAGNGGRHRAVRPGTSIAGSPANEPPPLHGHHQGSQQQYVASPAYTDGSPLSTASSAVLFHARGRTSPQFTTMGIRATGTPVPSGGRRFGMSPALPPHAGGGGGGGGNSGGSGMAGPAGRDEPTGRRHPITNQAPLQNQRTQFRPVTAAAHHPPHPHHHHHHHQVRETEPHQTPVPTSGFRDDSRHAAIEVVLQQQASTVTTSIVAGPSPPPLLRLSPRRPRFAGGRSARPPTPVGGAGSSGIPAGGGGGDGGRGGGSPHVFNEACVAGGAGTEGWGSGSGPIGRTRSGSGHRRLRLPSLNGGRRRLRSRSNSYDFVHRSRSGSPGMFFLGNASPKAGGGGGGGGGGGLERRLSGAIWTAKRWPTPRRQRAMMESWDEVDDVSGITTR